MSKIHESFFYNLYDLIKNVYVYYHMDTYLIDKELQTQQNFYMMGILFVTLLINTAILLKLFLIILYFIIIHTILNFIKFINSLFKTKCKINWKSTMKNTLLYFKQLISRIYFYNFYKYDNMFISLTLVIFYITFITSNSLFLIYNYNLIEEEIKAEKFFFFHFLSIETSIIIELSCCIIYSMRKLKLQFFLIIFFTLALNGIFLISYFFQEVLINKKGYIATNIPIIIDNIIFNIIFLILHINAFINVKTQNRTSKISYYL